MAWISDYFQVVNIESDYLSMPQSQLIYLSKIDTKKFVWHISNLTRGIYKTNRWNEWMKNKQNIVNKNDILSWKNDCMQKPHHVRFMIQLSVVFLIVFISYIL